MTETPSTPRPGRARATTHGEISHIALTMFLQHGFDRVTVADIAAEAGIGRRTFFRYFTSKNDLPWGEFDILLDALRKHLASIDRNTPMQETLRQAIIEFNRYPQSELPYHRDRMWLLLNVPSLQAYSTLRYAEWRAVIADFVADRIGEPAESFIPQIVAWTSLGICVGAYEQWLADESSDLIELLSAAFDTTAHIFGDFVTDNNK